MDEPESSTTLNIHRNDDLLTQALRDDPRLDIYDIARLNRAMSPEYDALSSLGTSPAVFSAEEDSTVTKPTSAGTPYPEYDHKGKGKAKASYPSSLSVAHGSEAEAEARHDAVRREAFFAMGDWTVDCLGNTMPLKGTAQAKTLVRHTRSLKHKKPSVTVIQGNPPQSSNEVEEHASVITVERARGNSGMLLP